MNRAIELHDSSITSILLDGNQTVVTLNPAYIHESDGVPGIDKGSGFTQQLEIRISDSNTSPNTSKFPTTIFEGSLVVGDTHHENLFPLPMIHKGPTVLRCVISTGDQIIVSGNNVVAVLKGEKKYVEEFD